MKNKVNKFRVLIADAHPVIRQCLRLYLELNDFRVVAEVASGVEAVEYSARLQPDVAIVDMYLPQGGGAKVAACLKRKHNTIRVLLLTPYDDRVYVGAAIEAGADACILKTAPLADLCRAVEALGSISSAAQSQYSA